MPKSLSDREAVGLAGPKDDIEESEVRRHGLSKTGLQLRGGVDQLALEANIGINVAATKDSLEQRKNLRLVVDDHHTPEVACHARLGSLHRKFIEPLERHQGKLLACSGVRLIEG